MQIGSPIARKEKRFAQRERFFGESGPKIGSTKMAKSAPAFQFYPESYLGGTALFTHEQKGIYMDMLSYQWIHGRLPKEPKLLARMIHSTAKKVVSVLHKFDSDESGLFNGRLEKERVKQETYRTKQAELGRKSWEGRGYPIGSPDGLAGGLAKPARKSPETKDIAEGEGESGKPRQNPADGPTEGQLFADSFPFEGDTRRLWIVHARARFDSRKPYTPLTVGVVFKEMVSRGESSVREALSYAIQSGSAGLTYRSFGNSSPVDLTIKPLPGPAEFEPKGSPPK